LKTKKSAQRPINQKKNAYQFFVVTGVIKIEQTAYYVYNTHKGEFEKKLESPPRQQRGDDVERMQPSTSTGRNRRK